MQTAIPSRRFLTFWRLQTGGWLLYTGAMGVSYIPLRHVPGLVVYFLTFLGAAFLESFAMYAVCRTLWRRHLPFLPSLLCCLGVAYIFGLSCSAIATWSDIRLGGVTTAFSWGEVFAGAIPGGFVFVTWSAFYFGIKHYMDLEEQKARLLAAEATARESQLRALRYQLQPHFLFNTLNAISSLVVSGQPQPATQMIARLADLLRNTLDSPDRHFVSLAEELAAMEEYLSIEKVRFGSRLHVSIEATPVAQRAQIPRFLLQPLIENAIKHGVSRIHEGGQITIRARAIDSRLEIAIKNDVCEAVDFETIPNPGLGLSNTLARIEHIYGAHGTLSISGLKGVHFLVMLSIPSTVASREAAATFSEVAP